MARIIEDVKPGDVIRVNGLEEYVFTDGEELYLNACNEHWIANGRRGYGEEGYPLWSIDLEGAEIVGHYGDGWFSDGWKWYAGSGRENKWRVANGFEPRPNQP